uniref:MFS transporter n=1 Tax=Bacillus maqinnsis TaxID=3229854 RepID=UPI003EB878AD
MHVQGIGIGVLAFLLYTGNLIISLTFPARPIGIGNPFLIYAVIGVAAFLFVKYLVRETKGESLEEIEEDLRNRAVVKDESETV